MSSDDELLERLHSNIRKLEDRRFDRDPLIHDKITALANYADYVMSLTQPVSTPSGGSGAHAGQLTCPRCSQKVTVTLT